jgi:hypothetical protein
MVLATAFVVSVAATFGRQSNDIQYRMQRDYLVARTWESALALVDDKASNSSLGMLPATIAFSLNGISGTLTVSNNSATLSNSLLVTTTLTAPDGATYPESGIVAFSGGYLLGSYWWTNGSAVSSNYLAWLWEIDNGTPTGTFQGDLLNYAGTSTSTILSWLGTDSKSYSGASDNLTDGVVQLDGYVTTPSANTIIKATSEYGSFVSIDGDAYTISPGAAASLKSATVTIPTAGTYPIFATYYNHTGSGAADFQLQWSTNAGVTYTSIPINDIVPLAQSWAFNGSAAGFGNGAELVNGGLNQAGSAWVTAPVNVNNYHCSFDFMIANPVNNGFAFVMQGVGTGALGTNGNGIGYSGINNSIALTFQLTNPTDYWNLTDDGVILTSSGIALGSYSINLASGDLFHCAITQSGSNFSATLTDRKTGTAVTGTESGFTPSSYIGSTTGYVGFTAGTSATSSSVYILNLNIGP